MAWGDDQARDRIIRTILGEAAPTRESMISVAHVLKTRIDSGAWGANNRVTPVVLAPKQFSVWNGGQTPAAGISRDDPRYQRAGAIADGVFGGQIPDNTGGATHYYAPSGMPGGAPPNWAVGQNPTTTIGGQHFYRLALSAANTANTANTATAAPAPAAAAAPAATPTITPIQSFTGGDYGRQATAAAQPFKGIVMHIAGKPDLQSELAYNSTPDASRGGVYYGYHYLVDRDGKVYQTAPDNVRTNHIQGNAAGLNNENAIGVSFIGGAPAGKNPLPMTPAQQQAGIALVNQLKAKYNIDPSKIVSHGELDASRASGLNPDGGSEGKDFIAAYRASAAAPTSSQTVSTTQPAAAPYFLGDSIAQGLRTSAGAGAQGDAVVGRNPAAVLQAINATPAASLVGRPIVLSTGLSNNPGDIAGVQQQFDALKAKGVNPADIHVVGLGSRSDIAAMSPALQKLVTQNGATYTGDFQAGADGVHPADYGGVLSSLKLDAPNPNVASTNVQPATATAPGSSGGKFAVPPAGSPGAGFVGPGSDKYSVISSMTTGTSHYPQLTTAANWGHLGDAAPVAPSATPAATPAAVTPPAKPLDTSYGPQLPPPTVPPGAPVDQPPSSPLSSVVSTFGSTTGDYDPAQHPGWSPNPDRLDLGGWAGTKGEPTLGFPAMTSPFATPPATATPPPNQVSQLPGSMLASAQNLINLLFPPNRIG